MTVMSENNEILVLDNKVVVSYSFLHQFLSLKHVEFVSKSTGTPPLTRFFGPWKNRVKGELRYKRSILVLKPQNVEFEDSKSTFSLVFTSVKLHLHSLHLICHKAKRDLMQGILIHFSTLFNTRNSIIKSL